MEENIIWKKSIFCIAFLYTTTVYPNVIWPALLVGSAVASSLHIIAISIVIEALLLYWFVKNISYSRALCISCIGNAGSAFVGSIVMALAMLIWHFALDNFLGGTFSLYNIIANYFLMYIGSSVIELFTIKLFFHYSAKQLWIPVFIGNFITYGLVGLFRFYNDILTLLGFK